LNVAREHFSGDPRPMAKREAITETDATKSRLLEAAIEVFAERGFECATVREICAQAGANGAAVNYHFGDKRGLYRETLFHAYRCVEERVPIDGGVPDDAPALERLRGHIAALLQRMLLPGTPAFAKLTAREISEPTEALGALAREALRPNYARLCGIVRELCGPAVADDVVHLLAQSVIGQCTFYRHCAPIIAVFSQDRGFAIPAERTAEHIFALMRDGIAARRAEAEGRPEAAPDAPAREEARA